MDVEYQRWSDISGGGADVISVSKSRTKGLYCDEESQGECVKPLVRTCIPDNSLYFTRDRLEVRFHLGSTNIYAEERFARETPAVWNCTVIGLMIVVEGRLAKPENLCHSGKVGI